MWGAISYTGKTQLVHIPGNRSAARGLFWNSFDSVVYFGTILTMWFILEQFRQCGLFWNSFDSVVYFVFHYISDILLCETF